MPVAKPPALSCTLTCPSLKSRETGRRFATKIKRLMASPVAGLRPRAVAKKRAATEAAGDAFEALCPAPTPLPIAVARCDKPAQAGSSASTDAVPGHQCLGELSPTVDGHEKEQLEGQ